MHTKDAPRRFTYRFTGEVEGVVRRFLVREGTNHLGSHADCDIVLDAHGVSRHHAVVTSRADRLTVRDEGSRNGTYVNGVRCARATIRPGDTLRFGIVSLVVEAVDVEDQDLAIGVKTPSTPAVASSGQADLTASSTEESDERASSLAILERFTRHLMMTERPDFAAGVAALKHGLHAREVYAVEWPGQGDPLVLACAGEIGTELPLRELASMSRRASQEGDTTYTTIEGSPPVHCAFHAGGEGEAIGLVVVGDAPRPKDISALLRLATRVLHHVHRLPSPTPETRRQSAAPRDLLFPPDYVPGNSPAMSQLYREMRVLVDSDLPVLVVGETGVGKEHVARILHASSPRHQGPFVAINCAAIPTELLEAELFGIEKGVATGVAEREGKFRLAHGGVVFLDEIVDMPLPLQAKLLRVLQDMQIHPVGARRPIAVDVAVVSATNSDPERLLTENMFRADLYYRLAGYVLRVPPLRHRREDIPVLVEHFIRTYSASTGKSVRGITLKALRALENHSWPGNVRELEHEVRRLVYLCAPGQPIDSSLLPHNLRDAKDGDKGAQTSEESLDLPRRTAELERVLILRALDQSQGNRTRAAALLRVTRNGLALKMRRLGLLV